MSLRCFSTARSLANIKPVFTPHHSRSGAKSFDKSFLPRQKESSEKPWVRKNVSKDEFFSKKYSFISATDRSRLDAKVDRQKRSRAARKDHESLFERPRRQPLSQAFRNPLSEYVYGTHPVLAALKANRRGGFNQLFVHNPKEATSEIIRLAERYGVKVTYKDTKNDLNILCDNGVHNGVVLETRKLQLPSVAAIRDADGESGEYTVSIYETDGNFETETRHSIARDANEGSRFPLGIFLDGITDPQNVGAIVRSAYYLGADFIVAPVHDTAKMGPAASKASAGALELMPVYQTEEVFPFIDGLKLSGWNVVTTSARPSETEKDALGSKHHKIEEHLKRKFVEASDLPGLLAQAPLMLVMGSEGEGVRTHLKMRSDYLVGLERSRMDADDIVDSLNVSVAAALLLGKCVEK